MADVGNSGLGVLRHDDARRDVGPAGLERQQRLAAGGIDSRHQWKPGPILVEDEARALPPIALLHGLADVAERDRAVDVDQLPVLAQHIEELAKVLIGHLDLRKHGASHGDAGKLARYYLPGPNAAQIRARPETRCRIEW